jgi:hypothetical protein
MVLDPTETVPPPRDRKESGAEEIAIAEEAEADPPFEGAAENCSETLKFSPVVPLDQERAFRELRELWQRGWAADDSPKAQALVRQAFAKACRDVTPTAILDAARTWVAAADAPRYLPALPQWLMANGWEKPPPAKATRASHSKRGHNGYQRKGGKPDLMRMSLKRGGYLEDENGKLYHPDGEDGCSFDWRASL